MTDDLRAFLEARLAEDERGALIGGIQPDPWQAVTDADGGPSVRTGIDEEPEWQREINYQVWHCDDEADDCPEQARMWIAEAEHIARHDPARVLREVEAKRRILGEHQPLQAEHEAITGCSTCSWRDNWEELHVAYPCVTVRLLALPFADHPAYLPSWAPDSVVPPT